MIENILGWASNVEIRITGPGVIVVERMHNLITDVALEHFAETIRAEQTEQLDIRYVAIGDNDAAEDVGNTTMANEVTRKALTGGSRGGIGESTSICVFNTTEANFQWEEIGFFAGNSATATTGTGILLARVLYSHNKVATETIQVTRLDRIGRA